MICKAPKTDIRYIAIIIKNLAWRVCS